MLQLRLKHQLLAVHEFSDSQVSPPNLLQAKSESSSRSLSMMSADRPENERPRTSSTSGYRSSMEEEAGWRDRYAAAMLRFIFCCLRNILLAPTSSFRV